MRPIKFRAWDVKNKTMLYPKDGLQVVFTKDGGCVCNNKGNGSFKGIVMQFTGLLDKNGVEIYEGDIIYTSFNKSRFLNKFDMYLREINHIVKWDGVSWNIPNIELEFREALCTAVYNSDKELPKWEVIGNIHENKTN